MFSENREGFGQFPAGDYRTNMLTEDGPSFVQILTILRTILSYEYV